MKYSKPHMMTSLPTICKLTHSSMFQPTWSGIALGYARVIENTDTGGSV